MSAPTVEGATEAAAPVTVRLRGIGKRFPGVIANDDINIDVRRGTIHAIVGENGAGKSTLMKILYGVQPPDSGTIEIEGNQVSLHSPADAIKAGVGMVFQHFMLADNFTVLENVVLGAEKLHGIGGGRPGRGACASPTPTAWASSPTGWSRSSASAPASGSRSSRCSTAAPGSSSSTSPPRCWCRRRSTSCSATCAELKKEGLSVIFISHKLDEVLSVADEITVIRRGTTVRTVLPTEVTARQLAELMVGSELPSPSTETSTVTDEVLLSVKNLSLPGRRLAPAARRHQLRHPQGRGARHRRRRGQRPGRARRVDHGRCVRAPPGPSSWPGTDLSQRVDPRPARGRRRLHPRGPAPARPAAGRAAVGEPGARPPEPSADARSTAAHRQGASRARTPSGSSASTTSARPARTCWPGRCRAATSRSSSWAGR